MPLLLARNRHGGAAASQRPCCQGFHPMARAGRRRGLQLRNDVTLHGRRGVSASEQRGDASFRRPSRGLPGGVLEAPMRDVSTSVRNGSSRILSRRDAIPLESLLSSSPSFPSSSSGEYSSDSPSRLDLARHFLSVCRSRFFFFSFVFSMSFTDFCFSVDARLFHDRRCLPSPEDSRTGHRSSPVRAGITLGET